MFLYKAGRSGLLWLPSPSSTLSPSVIQSAQTCNPPVPPSSVKEPIRRRLALEYICIYLYMLLSKRGAGSRTGGASGGRGGPPGIRARGRAGRRMQRRGRSGAGCRGGTSSQVKVCCEECQLIMSLLLTPYVEFFMLSFTSLLKTDKFCVNLDTHTETRTHTRGQQQ